MKKIYLAGGCFWGVEEYFSRIEGIINTTVGYANSNIESPTYEQVCTGSTGSAEALYLMYNEKVIRLDEILDYYFQIIDPVSVNKQGGDVGTQYRTGIYYTVQEDMGIIKDHIERVQVMYDEKITVEVMALDNFYEAEEYHQDYLKKNPNGYCHINLSSVKD